MFFEKLDIMNTFIFVIVGSSLVVMILVQMISSVLNYRGSYLRQGIQDLIETLDPTLVPHSEKLATDVLTHKIISDSVFAHVSWAPLRWKMATTIEVRELAKMLRRCSDGRAYAPQINAILKQVSPEAVRQALLMVNTANSVTPPPGVSADQLLKQMPESLSTLGQLEDSFKTVMQSVSQRFTLQMRIWSIVFSMAVAFAFQLDAVKIYSMIPIEKAFEVRLDKAADALLQDYLRQQSVNGEANTRVRARDLAMVVKDVQEVQEELSKEQVTVLPTWHVWWESLQQRFLGILATAALLSLAAPALFNLLKGLANLRSTIRHREKKQKNTE